MQDEASKREEAMQCLRDGDAKGAFSILRWLLEYPASPDPSSLSSSLDALARVTRALQAEDLAQALERAKGHTDDPTALYDAAFALYEHRLHGIAATLLARANRLAPSEPKIVCELSANLEALMLNHRAAEHIRTSGLADHVPMCRYLLAFNALMSGDLQVPRTLVPSLRESDDPDIVFLGEQIDNMLARADAVASATSLSDEDLSGWHVVLGGTLLLHVAADGYDDGMRGRYAALFDDVALIKRGIERMKFVADEAGLVFDRIFALPDRDSSIVATAAGEILGLPVEDWPATGTSTPGLIVGYELERIEDRTALEPLRQHHPGQVLYVHGSSWTEPFPLAPDVANVLHQHLVAPWDEGRPSVDPESGEVTALPADDASEDELVQRIVDAQSSLVLPLNTDESLAALIRGLSALQGPAAAGIFRVEGPRARGRVGSPVKSNRFL